MAENRPLLRRLMGASGILAVVLLLLVQVSPEVNRVSEDESTVVYDGVRVTQGQVPYRGFFEFIPPGTLYVLAGAHYVSAGHPETSARYAVLLAVFLAWGGAYLSLSNLRVKGLPRGLLSALIPVCIYPFAPSAPHHWFGTAALLWVVPFAVAAWQAPEKRRNWLAMGALCAVSAWFMQTEGLLAAVLILFSALSTSQKLAVLSRKLLYSTLAFALVSGMLWSPILLSGGAYDVWWDVIIWPVTRYRRAGNVNDLPLLADLPGRLASLWRPGQTESALPASLAGSLLYAVLMGSAIAAVIWAAWRLLTSLRHRKLPDAGTTTSAAVVLLAAAIFIHVNPTWVHLIYLLPPVLLLQGAAVLKAASGKGKKILQAACVVLLVLGGIYHGRSLAHGLPASWELLDVDRVDRESPLNQSLRESGLFSPGDSIVVLPSGGNVYMYTYPAAIGYTYLFPLEDGYHDLEDHAAAAAEIEARRPRAILIHRVREKDFLSGGPLAKVIERNYALRSRSPAVDLYLRRGEEP